MQYMKQLIFFFTLMLCLWSCESKKRVPFARARERIRNLALVRYVRASRN